MHPLSNNLRYPDNLQEQQFLIPKIQQNNQQFSRDYIYIRSIQSKVTFFASKETPLKITFNCSDENNLESTEACFILKNERNGDIRKESRTIEFINYLNEILDYSHKRSHNHFSMPSYAIIPLTKNLALIEFCSRDFVSFDTILQQELNLSNLDYQIWQNIVFQQQFRKEVNRVRAYISLIHIQQNFKQFRMVSMNKLIYQVDCCLKHIYCTLFNLFGLGDRHLANLLINVNTGEWQHIDFDCIFWKGQSLEIPEYVNFRLTKNMVAPLGVFRYHALLKSYMIEVARIFRKNAKDILTALDCFIDAPLKNDIQLSANLKKRIQEKLLFTLDNSNIEQAVIKILDVNAAQSTVEHMYKGFFGGILKFDQID